MASVLQVLLNALVVFAPLSLMTLAFAAVMRTANHLHFALPAIWVVAAYVLGSGLDAGLNATMMGGLAVVVSIVLSVLCYAVYQRLHTPFTVALVGFGMFLVIAGGAGLVWGSTPVGQGPDRWIAGGRLFTVGGGTVFVTAVSVVTAGILLVVLVALSAFYARTRYGLFAMAVAQNRELGIASGIRVGLVEVQAYILSGLLAGLSAVLHVAALGASPAPAMELFIPALVIVLLAGPVIIATVVVTMAFGLVWALAELAIGTVWASIVTYTVFIAAVVVWPRGVIRREMLLGVDRLRVAGARRG